MEMAYPSTEEVTSEFRGVFRLPLNKHIVRKTQCVTFQFCRSVRVQKSKPGVHFEPAGRIQIVV